MEANLKTYQVQIHKTQLDDHLERDDVETDRQLAPCMQGGETDKPLK